MEGDGSDSLVSGPQGPPPHASMAAPRGPRRSFPSALSLRERLLLRSEGGRVVAPLPLRLPRPGFRNPGRPLSAPQRAGPRVPWARERAPIGCGDRPPKPLGESGRGSFLGSGL